MFTYSSSGFFILDLQRLLKGKVEKYKLMSNVGGHANKIDNSIFTDRLSIIQTFERLTVIPFAHLNMINCIGMEQKNCYLTWREKNGFFSALNLQGVVTTWSLINGQFLYTEDFSDELQKIKHYEVYTSDTNDITYTRNFYSFDDESITLLKNKTPLENAIISDRQENELKKHSLEELRYCYNRSTL